MSTNRLTLTNEDLKDVFKFRNFLKLPENQIYCKIYGKTYETKDGTWLFDSKEELIETFMTSEIFMPLWDKLIDIVKEKFSYLFTKNGYKPVNDKWWEDRTFKINSSYIGLNDDNSLCYLDIHNLLENCINYYKEVLINRMIRTRVIVFHKYS